MRPTVTDSAVIRPTVTESAVIQPTVAAPAVIEVRGLRKAYGAREVLRGIDLTVRRGEIFAVLGLNGAGKTSAVETVQGLRRADAGQIRVLDLDPHRQRRALRSLVGAQLQSSSLPERLRVGEALRSFARLAGDVVDWRELQDRWGLTALRRTPFGSLSGGERQRLFVALALVNDPRVVFLDELTQGLDPTARRETWELVRQVRDRGATVVLVSHSMEEVEHLADRAAVLHDGRIVACDTPARLVARADGTVRTRFTRPVDPPTRRVPALRLEQLPGVESVTHEGPRVEVLGDRTTPVLVAAELARVGILPGDLTVVRPSLEDVFVRLVSGEVAA